MSGQGAEQDWSADGVEVAGAMRVWLDPGGILRATTESRAEISLDEALEFVEAARGLVGNRARPLLLDLRGLRSITRSARTFWVSKEANAIATATAIVVERGPSRVIGHFLLGLDGEDHPVCLFDVPAEALAWLAAS